MKQSTGEMSLEPLRVLGARPSTFPLCSRTTLVPTLLLYWRSKVMAFPTTSWLVVCVHGDYVCVTMCMCVCVTLRVCVH